MCLSVKLYEEVWYCMMWSHLVPPPLWVSWDIVWLLTIEKTRKHDTTKDTYALPWPFMFYFVFLLFIINGDHDILSSIVKHCHKWFETKKKSITNFQTAKLKKLWLTSQDTIPLLNKVTRSPSDILIGQTRSANSSHADWTFVIMW
jgi:hypothetical protein